MHMQSNRLMGEILGLLVRMLKILLMGFSILLQAWKQFVFSLKIHLNVSFHYCAFYAPSLISVIAAGDESELLVGIKNEGESSINVIAIQATVHLPFDHHYLVQNLSVQAFNNASVPPSAQSTFPYLFSISKFLQAGAFDLVGTIVYETDQNPYQSTFYNGTIDVIESGGLLSVESVFLFFLGVALLGLFGFWICSRIQHFSMKTKRTPKVEVGTGTTDASLDEWLQISINRKEIDRKENFCQQFQLLLARKSTEGKFLPAVPGWIKKNWLLILRQKKFLKIQWVMEEMKEKMR